MIVNDVNAFAHPRRRVLQAGCALPALLALPAGLACAPLAAAQSTIGANQYSTVNLSPGTNPLSITAGTTIAPGNAAGVFGAGGTTWQLDNAGDIDAGGDGIQLQSAGMVTNTGTVTGADAMLIYGTASVSNAGTITGNAAAIRLQAGGSVANAGLISAGGYGILTQGSFAAVSNTGTILAGDDGISLNDGGAVTNSGTVEGVHLGIYTGHAAGTVSNSGLVSASIGDAVSLYGGGRFANGAAGILHGGYSGLYAAGAAVVSNAGLITGTSFGVYLNGAATLSNTGSIAGGLDGVIDVGTHGEVINNGEISGTVNGARLGARGTLLNAGTIAGGVTGVTLAASGVLDNTGLLQGGLAGVRAAGLDTIENAGTIVGGVTLGAGGSLTNSGTISGTTAISLTGADALTFETGSVITGAIGGGGGASQIALAGTGMLASNLTNFGAGSALAILPGADWTVAGNWAVPSIVNAGTLQPGAAGQTLSITGNFTQTSTGMMRVAISPDAASALAITGSASLAGGLLYVLAPGAYAPGSTTFLTAAGGITGGFTSAATGQPASTPAVQVTPPPPPPVATATPQSNNAPAIPPPNPAPAAAGLAPPRAASQAIASPASPAPVSASPPITSATPVTFAEVGGSARFVVTRPFTVAPADDTLYSAVDQDMTQAATRAGDEIMAHATAADPSACLPASTLPGDRSTAGLAGALASAACRLGGWAEATATTTTVSGAYDSHDAGFLGGLDRELPGSVRVGLAIGYDAGSLQDDQSGRAETDTLRAGLYGALPLGVFTLSAEATDAFATIRTDRATGAGNATARPHANIAAGAFALSAPFSLAGLSVLPSAGLRIAHVSAGAATEAAALSAFALSVGAATATSLRPFATVTLARNFVTESTILITPSLTLGASYEAGTDSPITTLTANDTTLATRTTALARADGLLNAGVTASRGAFSLNLRYSVQAAANYTTQTAEAALQMSF